MRCLPATVGAESVSLLPGITRRRFLIGSAAVAGGVAFGIHARLDDADLPDVLGAAPNDIVLNPWVVISDSGITVITPRAEMGQGIHTTLAALVAEELDVPMSQVRAEHGPASIAYANPAAVTLGLPFPEYTSTPLQTATKRAAGAVAKLVGVQMTGASSSTRGAFETMRSAGAAARETLIAVAAERLDVAEDALSTDGDGAVLAPDGRRIAYGALAADAATRRPPRNPALKSRADWRHLGTSLPRLDMRPKVTGEALFGIDTRIDGMSYGAVRMSPRLGGEMIGFDARRAERLPGVEHIVDLGNGVGVIATSTWRAFRAVSAIDVEWGDAPYPPETEGLMAAIARAFDDEPDSSLRDDGDAGKALGDARAQGVDIIEAEYRVPYLAHATMEPMNATARVIAGDGDTRVDVWAGNQVPTVVRDNAARIAGVEARDVHVHTPYLGGGFGRRAEYDFTDLAVRLALRVPGRAVKLTWTREEDMRHDFYRPAAIARLRGALDGGRPHVLEARIASPSVYAAQSVRAAGFAAPGQDKLLVEGAFDQPYAVPHYAVHGHVADVAVPIGSWRAVGNSYNGFFHECFLDELAASRAIDPLAMRLAMMAGVHAPSRLALEAVAEMCGWGKTPPEGHARGLAFTHSFGAPTAQVVEVSASARGIRLEKVWCAIDVGTALDPRNIEAQVQGAIVFGLSAAISGEITFENGEVMQGNFDDYEALRLGQSPVIEVRVLENADHIAGVGEPGVPPAAPALANALFALTGERIRDLPLGRRVGFA